MKKLAVYLFVLCFALPIEAPFAETTPVNPEKTEANIAVGKKKPRKKKGKKRRRAKRPKNRF